MCATISGETLAVENTDFSLPSIKCGVISSFDPEEQIEMAAMTMGFFLDKINLRFNLTKVTVCI